MPKVYPGHNKNQTIYKIMVLFLGIHEPKNYATDYVITINGHVPDYRVCPCPETERERGACSREGWFYKALSRCKKCNLVERKFKGI